MRGGEVAPTIGSPVFLIHLISPLIKSGIG
jgi:hypothetical protein